MVSGTGMCWGRGAQFRMVKGLDDCALYGGALGNFIYVIKIPTVINQSLVLWD